MVARALATESGLNFIAVKVTVCANNTQSGYCTRLFSAVFFISFSTVLAESVFYLLPSIDLKSYLFYNVFDQKYFTASDLSPIQD